MTRITVLCLILLTAQSAFGRAYFAPKREMIAKSQVIAIVQITDVISLEPEKRLGDRRARATIREVLKGAIEKGKEMEFTVPCFFPCAITEVSTGEYLVFLSEEQGQLQGNNWHLSYRPIRDGKVEWYRDDTSYELVQTELDKVVQEVREQLSQTPEQQGGADADKLRVSP